MRRAQVPELTAPSCFTAEFATSVGSFVIEAHRDWAPFGVDRLYSLLRASYYDDSRVYRVVPGWVAQFGYSGDPLAQRAQTIIPNDPVRNGTTNGVGVIAFSAAYEASMHHATNRTTELYINLSDHAQLDALGFSPIAHVVPPGMNVVGKFHAGYGEMRDACNLHGFTPCEGPSEARILSEGNQYLDATFPRLTLIHSAAVLPSGCALLAAERPVEAQVAEKAVVTIVVSIVAQVVAAIVLSLVARLLLRRLVLRSGSVQRRLRRLAQRGELGRRIATQFLGDRALSSADASAAETVPRMREGQTVDTLELRCHDSAASRSTDYGVAVPNERE